MERGHGRAVSQTVVSVGTIPEGVSGLLDNSGVVPELSLIHI